MNILQIWGRTKLSVPIIIMASLIICEIFMNILLGYQLPVSNQ